MAGKWKVNDGTQVAWGDKLHAAGDTFSASEEEIIAEGMGAYVTKVRETKAAPEAADKVAPKAADKAVPAPRAAEPVKTVETVDFRAQSK